MSAQYRDRPKWVQNALRENEIMLFKRLQACAVLAKKFVEFTNMHFDAQDQAIALGADPIEVRFGMRGLAAAIEAEKNAPNGDGTPATQTQGTVPDGDCTRLSQNEPELQTPGAPQQGNVPSTQNTGQGQPEASPPNRPKKRPCIPRFHAPQFMVLGWRSIMLLQKLAPMVAAQYRHLVECGIDVRRLSYEGDDAQVAALLLDELGVQYHEIGATDYERIREAIEKMEAWVRAHGAKGAAAEAHTPGEAAGADPPVVAEPEPESAPEPEPESETPIGREPAPYSAGKASLDWTKL